MTREQTLDYLYKVANKTKSDLKKISEERNPSLGISFPKLNQVAALIYKNNMYEFLDSKRIDIYEIQIIETYLIGKIKDIKKAIKYFEKAANYAKDWSVVDSLCQKFVICRKYPDETLKFLRKYTYTNDEYLNRIVAVVLLSHFLNDETIEVSLELLAKLNHPGYYTQMAVAWAYATVMVKYPEPVLNILKENRLLSWTHNKTIQKAVESFRIDDDTKSYIKKLRYKQ